MGRPKFTCTLPNLLRNTAPKDLSSISTLSFSFGLPDSRRYRCGLDDAFIAEINRHEHHGALLVP